MDQMVSGSLALFEILAYWLVSIGWFWLLDQYAGRRLGGKNTPGYMALRSRKFLSLAVVSGVSVLVGALFMRDMEIPVTTMTFLGVPYLAMWFYYLVSVFRRIKAEKNRNR